MQEFANIIIYWYKSHQRDLPWRHTRAPYNVWLSEIILQQTQVKQGLPYYNAFVERFTNVRELAEASEEEILKLWQGLGYYSRARNLHSAAKMVVEHYGGVFPTTYKELKKLKGVGDYTASAIASFCYDDPVAVLDGNVFRVLSRYLGIDTPINSTEGQKFFKAKAEEFLAKRTPAIYNQAIMEFGALQCKPKNPDCTACPLQDACVAYQTGQVEQLPIKLKKTKITRRYFNYLVILNEENTVLQKRTAQGIWRNLYQFPLIETAKTVDGETLRDTDAWRQMLPQSAKLSLYNAKPIKHLLSHQHLFVSFWIIEVDDLKMLEEEVEVVPWSAVERFPVPAVIDKFLKDFAVMG